MTSAEFSAPVVWQFLLTVAGAAAAAMQFVALRRERRAATLSAWNAGPAQILLFVAVCLFCFLGVGFVCAAAARELFPDANPQENLLLLVPAAQTLSLAALLGFTKIFPEAFPPRFDAPPERRAGLRALVAGRFGVPAFFAAGIFVVTVGAALTSAAVAR